MAQGARVGAVAGGPDKDPGREPGKEADRDEGIGRRLRLRRTVLGRSRRRRASPWAC